MNEAFDIKEARRVTSTRLTDEAGEMTGLFHVRVYNEAGDQIHERDDVSVDESMGVGMVLLAQGWHIEDSVERGEAYDAGDDDLSSIAYVPPAWWPNPSVEDLAALGLGFPPPGEIAA